jgi:hypothetical protein
MRGRSASCPSSLTHLEKSSRYPTNTRRGGPQSWSGPCGIAKISRTCPVTKPLCHSQIFLSYNKNNLGQGWTNPGDQIACVPNFYGEAPNSRGSTKCNLLHVILLAGGIFKWLLDFWKSVHTCSTWPLFTQTQRTFPYETAWKFPPPSHVI